MFRPAESVLDASLFRATSGPYQASVHAGEHPQCKIEYMGTCDYAEQGDLVLLVVITHNTDRR